MNKLVSLAILTSMPLLAGGGLGTNSAALDAALLSEAWTCQGEFQEARVSRAIEDKNSFNIDLIFSESPLRLHSAKPTICTSTMLVEARESDEGVVYNVIETLMARPMPSMKRLSSKRARTDD